MKKFHGLLLCSDVDGTIIDENNTVPKENIEAIKYFKAHGGTFTLASGRIPEALFPILGDIHPDFPVICHNGCSLYDAEKRIFLDTVPLDRGAISVLEQIRSISPDTGIELMTTEGIFVVQQNQATDRHITFEKVQAKNASSPGSVTPTWLKILFADEPETISAIQNAMEHSPYHKDYTIIRTHRYYYEIFNKKASKGEALKKLCDRYGIAFEHVIAVGDNDNDVPMLKLAGTSAVVRNGSAAAKAHADMVTARTNSEGAVAELISKL